MDVDSVETPENVGKMMKEHDSLWLLRGGYTPSCLYKPTYTHIYIVYIYILYILVFELGSYEGIYLDLPYQKKIARL